MVPILPLLLGAGVIAALALGNKDQDQGGQAPGGIKPIPPGGPIPGNPFDANLSPTELAAVQSALQNETDPAKLDAFAKKMLPDHPLAAGALESRANLLRLHGGGGGIVPPAPLPLPVVPTPQPLPPPPPPPLPVMPAVFPVAPPSFSGTPVVVTTHDAGPSGNLNVRATPNGQIIGAFAHGASVLVTGPAIPSAGTNWAPVTGPNVNGGTVSGFASADFLSGPGAAPMLTPTITPAVAPAGISVQTALVTTHDTGPSGNLNVRATPNGSIIGALAHGATVVVTGPQTSGFFPITGHDATTGRPISGFASTSFLTLQASPGAVSAGYAAPAMQPSRLALATPMRTDVGAGPSLPYAELQNAALALKVALDTAGCRSYNEPVVKRFQAAAKASGLYAGDVDGWYGVDTQASLAKLVGAPAPACFEGPTGGPKNPQEYWSPIGT